MNTDFIFDWEHNPSVIEGCDRTLAAHSFLPGTVAIRQRRVDGPDCILEVDRSYLQPLIRALIAQAAKGD